jgi:ketosteroid isomerase-like protein
VLSDRFEVIPDMRWEHIDEYVLGDLGVTVWRVKGNATDGTVLDYQGCDLFLFRDGLIQDKDTYWKIVQPK